jgi:hypothetical protein
MRKCPFCGAEVKFENPYLLYLEQLNKWCLMHHCNDKKMVMITADSKEDVIAEWECSYEESKSESM